MLMPMCSCQRNIVNILYGGVQCAVLVTCTLPCFIHVHNVGHICRFFYGRLPTVKLQSEVMGASRGPLDCPRVGQIQTFQVRLSAKRPLLTSSVFVSWGTSRCKNHFMKGSMLGAAFGDWAMRNRGGGSRHGIARRHNTLLKISIRLDYARR